MVVRNHEPPAASDGRRHTFVLEVPEDLAWFEGHFPGAPVLPGISTVHDAVLAQVHRLRPDLGQPSAVRNLKFHRIVGPGTELVLHLDFRGELRVDFEVVCGGSPVSSGRLFFGGFK